MQTIIVGGTDGAYHALKVNTGEPIWRVDVSKRAILNGALYRDGVAYITHGEENIGTTEMGMIARARRAPHAAISRKTRSAGARSASCRRLPRR